MSLKDAISSELNKQAKTKKTGKIEIEKPARRITANSLLIKNKLNKLFYLRDEYDEERAGLHASSIIVSENEFCYREQVLSLFFKQKQGEQLPVNVLRIFAAGNSIHEKWQNLFKKAGIALSIEYRRFSEEYDLFFTPDAEIILENKKYVIEIKSVNTFQFQSIKSHPSGQKQLQLYMHLLGIKNGFVLIEDKNTQDFDIIIQEYDYNQVTPILNRLNDVQTLKQYFLKHDELPPKKCKNCDVTRALKCNMRDACFNIGIGKQRL